MEKVSACHARPMVSVKSLPPALMRQTAASSGSGATVEALSKAVVLVVDSVDVAVSSLPPPLESAELVLVVVVDDEVDVDVEEPVETDAAAGGVAVALPRP